MGPILSVELDLNDNDFVILRFLGNLLCVFLGRADSSFPIVHTD